MAGIGGMETSSIGASEPHWFAVVEVDDVDARVEAAARLGATIIHAPHDVPGLDAWRCYATQLAQPSGG